RRVVADGNGGDTPLRLGSLAGGVDDERIDNGRWTKQRFWRACPRQGCGFAGQPFKRAMRAEMDQDIDGSLFAQPEIKSDISVTRRQVGIVVAGLATCKMATLRLKAKQ